MKENYRDITTMYISLHMDKLHIMFMTFLDKITLFIKTRDSESRSQEEAGHMRQMSEFLLGLRRLCRHNFEHNGFTKA